ncbi:MAG: hypothetical protein JSV43_04150 [Methanobacteriota archaeon]|nr:MAG: hypothetical protein JSV43_04150 [Euryarchaeota archaeon]
MEDLRELTILENPKGLVEVLAIIKLDDKIRCTDLINQGITRWTAEEGIRRLVHLGVLTLIECDGAKRSEQWYRVTMKGRKLVEEGKHLFDSMQSIKGKARPIGVLKMPTGSFSILALATEAGSTWHTEVVRKLGLCRGTISSSLDALKKEGLLKEFNQRGFPVSRVLYEPTSNGLQLGRNLLQLYPSCKSLAREMGRNPQGRKGTQPIRRGRILQSDLMDFSRTKIQRKS